MNAQDSEREKGRRDEIDFQIVQDLNRRKPLAAFQNAKRSTESFDAKRNFKIVANR